MSHFAWLGKKTGRVRQDETTTALRHFSAQRFGKEDAPLELFLNAGSQNADGDSLCWNRDENLSDNSCRATSSFLMSTYEADKEPS
jgi:hypothetical protein